MKMKLAVEFEVEIPEVFHTETAKEIDDVASYYSTTINRIVSNLWKNIKSTGEYSWISEKEYDYCQGNLYERRMF